MKNCLLLATFGLFAIAPLASAAYAQNVFPLPSGNVGIGTMSPTAKLFVNSGDNIISAVLATNDEGPGELRVHSYTTQPWNVASFGIVHSFYNDERNGFIKFWRGGNTNGGFLAFGSNGEERVRISPAGDVGIGTTVPHHRLQVSGPNTSANNSALFSVQKNDEGYGLFVGVLPTGSSWVQSGTYNPDVMYPLALQPNGGNVGIGTTSPMEKLSVNGKIRAKEVIVETTGWSDHVFADNYQLQPLSEVEQHIKAEKHLPGVPSAREVAEKGVSVGDMQAILLAKIEELTLHVISQEKRIQTLESENAQLKAK